MTEPVTSPLRVASVPTAHPYVAHLGDLGVVRLPDPVPPGAPPGRWWPPVALDPSWIAANAARFDLLHVHFGTESFPPAHLRAVVAALREAGRPLVFTVHDLENPQLADQAAHRAGLDVLVPEADALVTLTPGAAAEIRTRWGREALVVPHPHLLPLDAPLPAGRRRPRPVVGVHLRDLRPNVDGPGTVAALQEALGQDAELRVVLHDVVRDAAARDAVRRLGPVVEAPRPDDDELHRQLADLDVAVLPYRHGTHSGWAELCWDLGVAVVAPRGVGHVAEQHPCATWERGDPASLRAAVAPLLARARPAPGTAARRVLQEERRRARRRQANDIAEAHRALYAGLTGR